MYRLPVLIVDSGNPALSSTNTLSVRVCDCDSDGVALSCGAVAYTATGLSTGALMAILGCIITLLGKNPCVCVYVCVYVRAQGHSTRQPVFGGSIGTERQSDIRVSTAGIQK